MNAKFLEKLIIYRQTSALAFARLLLLQKIKYQLAVIGEKAAYLDFKNKIGQTSDIPALMLVEARAARLYWRKFGSKVQQKILWSGRQARQKDIANKLLDIGYHYLALKITKICQEINLPTELGLFHKAQSHKARPLVYDFMEPLRPIMVDDVLLKILGKKKKEVKTLNPKLISYFISRIKNRGERRYFHKNLGYCITLDYWIRLILLEFMNSVNTGKKFNSIFPSMRHETRCK